MAEHLMPRAAGRGGAAKLYAGGAMLSTDLLAGVLAHTLRGVCHL